MKSLIPLFSAVAAAAVLAGCATDMGGRRHADAYDSYYDGGYGAYAGGGYWEGETFYYRGHDGFVRDDAHHFHRDHSHGGHGFRSDPHP
jgi:hypothetical protein